MTCTNESSHSSSFPSRRRTSLLREPNSELSQRDFRDRAGPFSHYNRFRYQPHRSGKYRRSVVFATEIITALLFLLPSATTTFSNAFRLGLPRRRSPLVSTGIPIEWARGSSSRAVNTYCRLFRKDDAIGKERYGRGGGNSLQKGIGPFASRRDMTTLSKPTTTTSLMSSTASAFFFPTPSSREEKGGGYDQAGCTMESLCGYAEQLIGKNSGSQQRHKFCVYLAGGGSTAVSTLAATPGASSFLLEGRTTYDRHSYLNACEMPDRDTMGRGFSYGGEEAAGLASRAALKQALTLASMDDDLRTMPSTIGIGCASVLVSGEGSPSGKGTVVATAADGLVLTLSIEMKEPQRSRFDEELVLSHLVLRSAELLMSYRESDTDDDDIATDKEFMTRFGDIVTERWELPAASSTVADDDIDTVVEEAAKRVVDHGEGAVVLLPVYDERTPGAAPLKVRALSQAVLPNRSLVFPGSFNPVHVGHLGLANASIKTLEKHEPYVHPRRHNDKPIFFEISLTNADKPSIDPKIVASRVKKFIELASSASNRIDHDGGDDDGFLPAPSFPQQWGIVLTRAPLFEEKLKILRSNVLNRLEGPGDSPRINFVIGTDTMVRILNPKYYRDRSEANMIASLLELKASGAGFTVGGRLEQSTSDPASPPRFVSGREELVGLPDEVASMFTIMEESEFRVDLSSSEIRRQQERV
eukprot:CAMPEP_0197181600 /NCGR_PEP_ID=MMETSP1423-20130617/5840_1 /TAXON_ID=476441 /ORGANISM="Pseudo-nitzschia heimii, Strain UNC1101" /LENGTH=698 /DNA_ID=CAMNT_0042631887 /DNA_START=52 /DNA_END=2148 /DNA_ORIENTATION=-